MKEAVPNFTLTLLRTHLPLLSWQMSLIEKEEKQQLMKTLPAFVLMLCHELG